MNTDLPKRCIDCSHCYQEDVEVAPGDWRVDGFYCIHVDWPATRDNLLRTEHDPPPPHCPLRGHDSGGHWAVRSPAQRKLLAISEDLDAAFGCALACARAEGLDGYARELGQQRVTAAAIAARHGTKGFGCPQAFYPSVPAEAHGIQSYQTCGDVARVPQDARREQLDDRLSCTLPRGHRGDHECLGFSWATKRGGS